MLVFSCNPTSTFLCLLSKGGSLSLRLLRNLFSCWVLITVPFSFCRGAGNLNIRMTEHSSCCAVIFWADLVRLYGALCRPLISPQAVWPTPLGDKLKPVKDQDATSTPSTQRRTTMTINPTSKHLCWQLSERCSLRLMPSRTQMGVWLLCGFKSQIPQSLK